MNSALADGALKKIVNERGQQIATMVTNSEKALSNQLHNIEGIMRQQNKIY